MHASTDTGRPKFLPANHSAFSSHLTEWRGRFHLALEGRADTAPSQKAKDQILLLIPSFPSTNQLLSKSLPFSFSVIVMFTWRAVVGSTASSSSQ